MMCVGKRGRLRHMLVCFPTPKAKKGKRVGGREFAIIRPNHGTRLRPQCAWKSGAPARAPQGGGEPRGPRHRPDAQPSAVTGFPNVSTTTRTKKPSVQEVPRMVGKDNQKPHIRIHRMSSSSMEKQQKLFYTEEPDSSNPISPASPGTRRPSTSETPYQLGNYGPGCDGTRGREAAHRPPRGVGPVAGP